MHYDNASLLSQVATETGLSTRTVQRILGGGNKQVWASSARRANEVRRIAERLNYRPNGAAKAVKTGHFSNVALLQSTHEQRSNLPSGLLDGIHDTLAANDYTLSLCKLPDEKLTSQGFVPKILRQSSADGLIIDYTDHIPNAMIALIAKYRIPSVWVNSQQSADCVYPTDRDAAIRATEHLIHLGHREIAFLDVSHDASDQALHYSGPARREGYVAAMTAAGLSPNLTVQVVRYAERADFLLGWLRCGRRPTAVVTYSSPMGVALMLAAARLGLWVPKDLSVISFADYKVVEPGIILTTMLVPQYEMGCAAGAMLLQKLSQPSRKLPPREVPFGFLEGQTCASPA